MNDVELTTSPSGSIFPGLLFITFLVLQLTHVIHWSWWWVTAPLWGPAALALILFGIALCVAVRADR